MIATSSDLFSAFGNKIMEARNKGVRYRAIDVNGNAVELPISYNQSVIEVQLAAFKAMAENETFLDMLLKIPEPDYFVGLALAMARREDL